MNSDKPEHLRRQTHVEAFVRGEKLGHGAERNGVRAGLLQRLGRLTHQQARRHQLGGHFCQFKLEKLHTHNRERRNCRSLDLVSRGGETRRFHLPGCWTASLRTVSVPTGGLLRAARRRAPPPENRTLLDEEASADR